MNDLKIDLTWKFAASVIRLALENGTGEGKRLAVEELHRMAELADRAVSAEAALAEVKS